MKFGFKMLLTRLGILYIVIMAFTLVIGSIMYSVERMQNTEWKELSFFSIIVLAIAIKSGPILHELVQLLINPSKFVKDMEDAE